MTLRMGRTTGTAPALWCSAQVITVGALVACGGGNLDNPASTTGAKLSFVFYQKCVEPVLQAPLQVNRGGSISINSCAGGGCHSSVSGTGGALRIVPGAAAVPLGSAPDVIRAGDVYKNFYSAQASTIPGSPSTSRLLEKPLVQGVLHGGGLIFPDASDPNARLLAYWISRPVPVGQDELSSSANTMFTPNDPATGTCNTN
jgi:hypothetical protein